MAARVLERQDAEVVGPYDDRGLIEDLVFDEVARGGDLLESARHLPDTRPQSLDLQLVELRVEIPLLANPVPVLHCMRYRERRPVLLHDRHTGPSRVRPRLWRPKRQWYDTWPSPTRDATSRGAPGSTSTCSSSVPGSPASTNSIARVKPGSRCSCSRRATASGGRGSGTGTPGHGSTPRATATATCSRRRSSRSGSGKSTSPGSRRPSAI